ncbi:MAG: GNAT family N-acetyltransferase [Candidatus Eremiobacteraeota bacterium]|nr:GNAT family N-acetyltransferase [Candidatus Eremiobacteraeota bacterium]
MRQLAALCRQVPWTKVTHTRLRATVARGECVIARHAGSCAGVALWSSTFFDRTFIWLLFVAPEHRRRGVAKELLNACERFSPTDVFTSTNRSNKTMQRVLKGAGYRQCGHVSHLDPSDVELFYCKRN